MQVFQVRNKVVSITLFSHIFESGMIAFVRGHFAVKTPAKLVVDVNGVGYELQISLNTYSAVSQMESGLLHTYLHITENAQTLFGFADPAEKEMFLLLISVSGVGAATARMMLSGMKPDEIANAILQGNTRRLEGIKGIGKKSAERLVLELRDKLGKTPVSSSTGQQIAATVDRDAVNALIALGIGKPLAEQAVKKTWQQTGGTADLETLIKQALQNL
jgi:Holliday junction DNA helicase RuvA